MQRNVVHYDELTECGLFRNERGQLAYFRKDDAVYQQWMDDQPSGIIRPSLGIPQPFHVAPVAEVLPGASTPGGPRRAASGRAASGRAASGQTTSRSASAGLPWLHWLGLGLTALALLLLINAGGDLRKTGMGRNPKLIDSIWGLGAAVLLLIELIYFSIGAPIRKIRTNYWGTVVCTVVAVFMLKSCDGYQADKVADVYTITLGALLLVVYLIPKR